MTYNDTMKFIESELEIISHTPCEVCSGLYSTTDLDLEFINDVPYDICICTCTTCGHEKIFKFCAPFIIDEDIQAAKNIMS